MITTSIISENWDLFQKKKTTALDDLELMLFAFCHPQKKRNPLLHFESTSILHSLHYAFHISQFNLSINWTICKQININFIFSSMVITLSNDHFTPFPPNSLPFMLIHKLGSLVCFINISLPFLHILASYHCMCFNACTHYCWAGMLIFNTSVSTK